jgi:hypothetical protein
VRKVLSSAGAGEKKTVLPALSIPVTVLRPAGVVRVNRFVDRL